MSARKSRNKNFKSINQNKTLSYSFSICLLTLLLITALDPAYAQDASSGAPQFDDHEIRVAACQLMHLMENSMGALLTAVAGVGAIVGAAFGAYRAATGLITVAVSAYILPAVVSLWFSGLQCQVIEPGATDTSLETPSAQENSILEPSNTADNCVGDDCHLDGTIGPGDQSPDEEPSAPSYLNPQDGTIGSL